MRRIKISKSELDKIRSHGEETYPEECCGVLIGTKNSPIEITEVRKMTNTNAGSRNTRYNIDPMELLRLEDELDERELEMIGIYHSHPNHPSKPSEYDLNHAWPNLTYMVLSVNDGKANLLTSWRLDDSGEKFEKEEIIEQTD